MKVEERLDALTSMAVFDSYNVALRRAYEDYKKARTLIWFTSGRDNVCEDCNVMHGTRFDIDQAEGVLPLHPQCACTWILEKELE